MGSNRTAGARCVTLAAAGDVSTGHTPPASAFAYVTDALRAGDIRFAQVERLYTERGTYQESSGALNFSVRQPPETAAAFTTVPFSVLSLASNYTGSWGPEAIKDTVDTFRQLDIPTIGVGYNLAEARKPAIIEKHGLRIAFLGYCSVLLPQFWATDERAGCVPMRAHTFYEPYEFQPGSPAHIITTPHQGDFDLLLDDVRAAKAAADIVIVSLHWGLHFTPKVQEYQPIIAHAAIDAGASVILGHHSHQQQAVEIYNDAVIYYGLGNLAFHPRKGGHALCMPNGGITHKELYSEEPEPGHYYDYRRHWNEGGIAYVELDQGGVKRAEYLPTLMNAAGQAEIVLPATAQFETTHRYLEWVGKGVKGGVTSIPVRNGRFVYYERNDQR